MRLPNKRQKFGFVQSVNNNNNTQQQQPFRDLFNQSINIPTKPEQSIIGGGGFEGGGFLDAFKDALSGIPRQIINAIPDSDDTARKGFSGEKHNILKLKNGLPGVANYMGPGTSVVRRLARNDPGRTPADTVSKRHDIDLTLSQGARNKDEQFTMMRAGDNRMIDSLKKIHQGKHGGDASVNIQAGLRLIQLKKKAEDLGVIGKQTFSGPLKNIPQGDMILLKNAQNKLTQDGFGFPADELRKKIISQTLRKRNKKKAVRFAGGKRSKPTSGASGKDKNNGASFSRDLGRSYKLKGNGSLENFILKKMIPTLSKSIGIKLPSKKMKPIVSKIISRSKGSIPKIIDNLSKITLKLLSGMVGGGIAKKHLNPLRKKLATAMLKMIQSNHKGGSMSGSGFFSDFKKGFKSVFVPGSKILGGIASALGQPELGIPLTIVGKLVDKL